MTWELMCSQCWRAGRALELQKNWRSSANRYYYAAFSAVTSEMRKRVQEFPQGYEHPPHTQVGRFVKRYMTQFSKQERDELRDAIKRLYEARVEADYRHRSEIGDRELRDVRYDAKYVIETMGVAV